MKSDISEQMRIHVQRWKSSGLTKKAYSIKNELSYDLFKYWCEKFGYIKKRIKAQGDFIELRPEPPVSKSNIEIIYPNGVRLLLPPAIHKDELRSMINLS